MTSDTTNHGRALGLPLAGILGLALLAAPRVVLHDLGLVHEGTLVNALLVFVPVALWVLVTVVRRVPNPFLTLLTVGAVYGVLLGVAHQVFWEANFDGAQPRLGGNLADVAPGTQELIIRGFAMISSLFTGVIVGAISGLIAWGIARLVAADRT